MCLHRMTAVLVCLLAVCGSVPPAHGSQLRLWPLVDYERTADGWSLDLFGPIFSARRSSTGTRVTVRPLVSFSATGTHRHVTVLYPLLRLSSSAGRTSVRFLGLGAVEHKTSPPVGEWRDYVRLPPFLYYRSAPSRRTSIAAVPVFADLADVLGQYRIRSVLFPLYLSIEASSGGARRTWTPFPIISVTDGDGASGVEIWPLFGRRVDGSDRSVYALWPMYVARTRALADGESERTVSLGPLHWRQDSPTKWSRGYLGFGHTVDRQRREERWDFPWPLWHFDRGPDFERLSLAPFYVGSQTSTISAGRVLWPLYRWQAQEVGGDETFLRYELLLGVWRWKTRTNPDGGSDRLHTLFPLFRHSSREDSSSLATLAILDSLFPSNPHVAEIYAPLWRVFTSRRRGGHTSWRILWGLLADEGGRLQYPIERRSGEGQRGDGG